MSTLRIDLETYSDVDLRKCGVHKYVESDNFQIMLFAYAYGDSTVNVVDLMAGEQIPQHVLRDLENKDTIKAAYNAAFEIACLSKHLGRQLDVSQWRCTSVHALYLGLPGNLSDVGKVIGLAPDQAKLSSGYALIRYFCIPCKPTIKNGGRLRNLPVHDPAKWELFKTYAQRDVETERAIALRLAKFPVPDVEWKLWFLDQRMNTRGIMVDEQLLHAAIELDLIIRDRLIAEAIKITGLNNPNSRSQLIDWLQEEEEIEIEALTKKTVPVLLKNTQSDTVRRVLEIRQELAKTSVSKYHAMDRAMCFDGRIRGLIQFYGANRTGRWAGRLVQVQNLPQNKLKDLDLARELVKLGCFSDIEVLFGNVPDTLSQLIRTAFVAPNGWRFIVVDFSAIEARVIAWLAWCQWRLDVFATHGMIYEASASQMFKVGIETIQYIGEDGKKHKGENYVLRQKGKISELALGYQGAEGALKTMGALEMGLTEDELGPIKDAWRKANPEIASFDKEAPGLWVRSQDAAIKAVKEKTTVAMDVAGGRAKLIFKWESGFLSIELPSGRKLFYVKPQIGQDEKYGRDCLTYEGMDQKTKKWTRLNTYGGKLIENITQAIARDCLREAMLAIDGMKYHQLMTVHDEAVIEMPYGSGSLQEVEEIMARPIAWAPDLQLRGDGFETNYYMKEID